MFRVVLFTIVAMTIIFAMLTTEASPIPAAQLDSKMERLFDQYLQLRFQLLKHPRVQQMFAQKASIFALNSAKGMEDLPSDKMIVIMLEVAKMPGTDNITAIMLAVAKMSGMEPMLARISSWTDKCLDLADQDKARV
jgi:hypothetical protein